MKQSTEPQSSQPEHRDRAENRLDRNDPTHWEAEGQDYKSEAAIRADQLPSDGAAGPVERPSGKPHPVRAQQPETLDKLKVLPPETYAAGLPGAARAFEHIAKQAGAFRGSNLMRHVNQKGGIDCMSCAWPEPDGERSFFEFCENGAKAVAWEATNKRVGRKFFANHSIPDLATRRESWLGDRGRITIPVVLRRGSQHYEPISWPDAF